MAGNDPHGGNLRQRGEVDSQPFNEPSMIGRCFTKTRSPANSVFVTSIEDGEVAIRMRRRPGLQFQRPSAEIERHAIGDDQSWRNELHLVDELVADDPAKRLEVEFAAHRQGSRQIVVADKGRADPLESRISEHMIRMLVRIDDIEDGLIRARADGGEQPPPIGTLPPVSTTATPLSPITKPILAMSPRFSSLIRRFRRYGRTRPARPPGPTAGRAYRRT